MLLHPSSRQSLWLIWVPPLDANRNNNFGRSACAKHVRPTGRFHCRGTRTQILLLQCPLLAQSGHDFVRRTCPLSGEERTCLSALHVSAYDPKRTFCHGANVNGRRASCAYRLSGTPLSSSAVSAFMRPPESAAARVVQEQKVKRPIRDNRAPRPTATGHIRLQDRQRWCRSRPRHRHP